MPRSINRPAKHWDIYDPDEVLSETRRLVALYKTLQNTDLSHALAALVKAGFAKLVGEKLPLEVSGPPPRGATDGSTTDAEAHTEESRR